MILKTVLLSAVISLVLPVLLALVSTKKNKILMSWPYAIATGVAIAAFIAAMGWLGE